MNPKVPCSEKEILEVNKFFKTQKYLRNKLSIKLIVFIFVP